MMMMMQMKNKKKRRRRGDEKSGGKKSTIITASSRTYLYIYIYYIYIQKIMGISFVRTSMSLHHRSVNMMDSGIYFVGVRFVVVFF